MSQASYSVGTGKLGGRATIDDVTSVSRRFAGQPQTNTLTFGGTPTDGDYSAEFRNLDVDNIEVTVTRATTPSTNDDLAAAWHAAAIADADLVRLFIITVASAVVTVVSRENGEAFDLVVTAVTGPATLVSAVTQTASPGSLPMGVGVALTGNGTKEVAQPDGSTAFQIAGITWDGGSSANASVIPTLGAENFLSPFTAGDLVPVMKEGVMWVSPEVAIAEGDPVFVRVVAAGSEVLGALRNDADGSDAVQIQATFETACAANELCAVRLNIPGGA